MGTDSRQFDLFSTAAQGTQTPEEAPVTGEPVPSAVGPGAGQTPGAAHGTMEALHKDCLHCTRCALSTTRTHVVISRGNPKAKLMLIGEGPGQQEDETGVPFVGRAGQLLDKILASVGIDKDWDIYICNVVKCRPPGNRKPTPEEMASCWPWLESQIQLVNPALVLLAGSTAMVGVLGIKTGITKMRGQWIERGGRTYMPVFHPSFLLRNPSRERGQPKWLTWEDFKAVGERLDTLKPGAQNREATH